MKIIGLTGSIGMGKSATAKLFIEQGVPVFDSDVCVHELYARGGAAVAPIAEAFPGSVVDGAVDRALLSAALGRDPSGFERLEKIVHPLVSQARDKFSQDAARAGSDMVVYDVPLLFETGGDKLADVIVVVHAPDEIRRARVLERPGMDEAKLDAIIARQMPDTDKLARADYAIETSQGLEDAREQVRSVIRAIREKQA